MGRASCSTSRAAADCRPFMGRAAGRRLLGCAQDRGASRQRRAIVVGTCRASH
jgi:hypothetical protein